MYEISEEFMIINASDFDTVRGQNVKCMWLCLHVVFLSPACCEFFRQVKTLEEELHLATNNLRGLEISEEKVSMLSVVM